jgi:hypothetical protein
MRGQLGGHEQRIELAPKPRQLPTRTVANCPSWPFLSTEIYGSVAVVFSAMTIDAGA